MKSNELLEYIIKTPKYYKVIFFWLSKSFVDSIVLILSENKFKILAAW